jgi:hypothetical protein
MTCIQARRIIIDVGCVKEKCRQFSPPELVREIELLPFLDISSLRVRKTITFNLITPDKTPGSKSCGSPK